MIFPAALAVDMTARNVQDELKAKRLPWTIAKGFDTFTPIRQDRPCFVSCKLGLSGSDTFWAALSSLRSLSQTPRT